MRLCDACASRTDITPDGQVFKAAGFDLHEVNATGCFVYVFSIEHATLEGHPANMLNINTNYGTRIGVLDVFPHTSC